jgi:hypothetical protein
MKVHFCQGALLLLALILAGCSSEQRGGPRMATYPVTGIVTVDGKPAAQLTVECHPEPGAQLKHEVATLTDDQGKFSIATYEAGDGIPEGSYKLAFIWIEPGIAARDRLKGAYADKKKSTHTVTVVKGQPTDLGTIELTTKK